MNINGIFIDHCSKFKSLRYVEWYVNSTQFIFFPFSDDDLYADFHGDNFEIQFKGNVK